MKKLITIMTIFLIVTTANAQEKEKKYYKELGIIFTNFDKFGLDFKIGKKSMWRFSSMLINGYNSDNMPTDSTQKIDKMYGFEIKMGKEFRANVKDNFFLKYGIDLSYNRRKTFHKSLYITQPIRDNESVIVREAVGFNLVFGFSYFINKQLLLSAELLPYFRYDFDVTQQTRVDFFKTDKSNDYNYGFDNNSALITFSYRFM